MVNGNVQVNYKQGYGMGIPQIQFNWTEIGKPNNQQDLYDAGMTNVPIE